MTSYAPPIDDIRFALRCHAGIEALFELSGQQTADAALIDQVLEEAGRFAAQILAPLNRSGDQEGAHLENGVVRLPAGFKQAYDRFVEGGWNGLAFPQEWGGQDLPWSLAIATAEMWHSANMAFGLCPILTQAGIELLLRFGSPDQQATYLPKLVQGRWTGSMCLTEPQAGTDLGALRMRAVPKDDHYRLFGTKIFITYGEHDLAENIIHMVLARLPDGPPGTRGLSLFLVPKIMPNADGSLGHKNDLRPVSLEHKLGIKASPTCVMSFGDHEGAVGYLIGQPHEGMRAMFTMMNNARLAVGLQGLAIAERAFQEAAAYAATRIQGTRPGANGPAPAPIIAHLDVRRMLASMQSQIAAMRAMIYHAAGCLDRARTLPPGDARRHAQERLDLLIPMVKAWCSDTGFEITSLALQVHGGMGYIEETGIAQYLRDARITMIYEGTNGIQALDLVGRKLPLTRALELELRADLARLDPAWDMTEELAAALDAVEQASAWLASPERTADDRAAGATPYLRLCATTLGGFLLARAACAAPKDDHKLALARFFTQQLLPMAVGHLPAVTGGADSIPQGPRPGT